MARRKSIISLPPQSPPPELSPKTESDSLTIEGVGTLSTGTMFSLKGNHGRFRFQKHVVNDTTGAEWIECFGGPKGHSEFRAFRPAAVRRIEKGR